MYNRYGKSMLFKRLLQALTFALLIVMLSCSSDKEDIYTFKLGHPANEDHTWHRAAVYFDSLLNLRTEGRVRVTVFANEQLGKETEMIRSIMAGITDMTITGGTLQNWTYMAAFTDMPFLLRDTIHMKAVAEGEVGKRMESEILQTTGLRPICYFQRGPRHLTTNRPIQHPDELKGLMIRIPNVPSYVTAWQALGAKPTPMSLSEVFTALQQGAIDGQENPLAMIASSNFQEVQKYVNLTGHVISWVYVVIGEKQLQRLPEKYRAIFLQAASDMQVYEHKLFLEKEAGFQKQLEGKGMTFVEVDQKAFRERAAGPIFNGLDEQGKKIYEQIESID
ncbi:MAG: TRAP transporter substrate-binding protein [Cyclobacteriaceae bacterium]|nr:TRAP transporter substrate-binding protein [Cyclobacteriaceae bacterium]